jgi:O-antigen/teichoic acid export membrane protein
MMPAARNMAALAQAWSAIWSVPAQYFSHGAVITAVLAIALLVVGAVVGSVLPAILHAAPTHHEVLREAFWVATLATASALVLEFVRGYAAANQRVTAIVVATVVGDLAAIATILLGLWSGMGLIALALGAVVRLMVPALVGSAQAYRLWSEASEGAGWSHDVFRDYFQTTPSLLAAKASASLSYGLPPILIARYVGAEATVIYSVSVRSFQVAELLLSQILLAGGGAISHLKGQADSDPRGQGLVRYALVYMAILAVALALVAFANTGFVSLWVGSEHYAGQWFTLATVGAGLGAMVARFFQHVVFNQGSMRAASSLSTRESLLRAAIALMLVPLIGIYGVPASIALAAVLVLPSLLRLARRTLDSRDADGLLGLVLPGLRLLMLIILVAALSPMLATRSWLSWLAAVSLVVLLLVGSVLFLLPALRGEVVRLLRTLIPTG